MAMKNVEFLDMEELTWVASFGEVKAKIQDLKVILCELVARRGSGFHLEGHFQCLTYRQ